MYDELAHHYDIMTNFKGKWQKQEALWKGLIDKYEPKTLLDYGCGTGFHSILLGSLGLEVIGVDISKDMVEQAERNRESYSDKSPVSFVKGDLNNVGEIHKRFDWIFCLGNTLAHFPDEMELKKFFILAYQRLNPGGILWIQLLNYDKILENRQRLIGITGDENHTFIRFNDFVHDKVKFNVLAITRDQDKYSHTWHQNPLNPITFEEIKKNLAELLLYERLDFYSDFKETPFDKKKSDNLVLLLHR